MNSYRDYEIEDFVCDDFFMEWVLNPQKENSDFWDNLELSSLMTPALTTVAQPMDEIGRTSAKIIINMVENNKLEQREVILPVSLKIRETTKLQMDIDE